ncbi:hypothetical protein [Bradyrhizobium sp. USDA 4353]
MSTRLTASSLIILAMLQAPSFAQGTASTAQSSAQGKQASTQTTQTLPDEIKQRLQKQGFNDVKVVPESFIVSAKDSNNDPVTMVIGPHSVTMFADIESQSGTTGSTTGSSGTHAGNATAPQSSKQ